MSRVRVAVVDDEPLAREVLEDLLGRDPEVELVASAGDGATAARLLRDLRPDIVFLDVEMPERGGLAVAAELAEGPPFVVFVTAHSRYAPEAFEVEAVDYLVKPFADERFRRSLARAKQRVREHRMTGLATRLAEEVAEGAVGRGPSRRGEAGAGEEASAFLERIPVRRHGRSLLLPVESVVWIESEDYYARFHTANASYLVRAALTSLERRLHPRSFLRVHRSAIVNLREVVAFEPLTRGAWSLALSNGARCRVASSRLAEVKKRLLPDLG